MYLNQNLSFSQALAALRDESTGTQSHREKKKKKKDKPVPMSLEEFNLHTEPADRTENGIH